MNDRGVIEPGMLADLIAVRGNPLEDVSLLEDVRFVMFGGPGGQVREIRLNHKPSTAGMVEIVAK